MSSPFAGAEMMTFFAPPPSMCARAFAASVKSPVDSIDDVDAEILPRQFAGIALGEHLDRLRPSITSWSPSAPTSPA